jgi:hypothetical protein
MANQFEIAGSQNPEKSHRTVPLATTKIFTGYWPNSAPYRDAAVPYLYEKFYGATRNDKIAFGLNVEVSPRMTLVRRPGNLNWNGNSWTNVTGFYSFQPFEAGVGLRVYVIVDTATAVYIGAVDGTQAQTLLYTKTGGGKSRFQASGNTLYWGDGVLPIKWSWFPAWTQSTSYTPGQCILDSSNNIWQSLGYGVAIVSTAVTSNICTVTYSGGGVINAGDTVTLYGLSTHSELNNTTVQVINATSTTFTFSFVTSNYGTVSDTGDVVDQTQGNGTSSSFVPTFTGTYLLDGTNVWQGLGSSVRSLGITAPSRAPTLQVTPVPAASSFAATTYYWPNPAIIDGNGGSGPWIWALTGTGTTNGSLPSGFTTGTPTPQYSGGTVNLSPTTITDGSAVWTCNGLAARQTTTAYNIGQLIAVTWNYTYYTYQVQTSGGAIRGGTQQGPNVRVTKIPHVVSYKCFFVCATAGTTSSGATSSIGWPSGLNASIGDGTVVWKNAGQQVTRTASATSAPSGGGSSAMTNGNVSNSQAVAIDTQIADSNGKGENVTLAGVSGASHPTWATAVGGSTTEASGLTWLNVGQLGSANTGLWFYSYTYVNTATGDESTGSPLSTGILLPASSGVQVSGFGSAQAQVNAVNIYRTVQQSTSATSGTPYFLTQIPVVENTTWSYLDTSPDPGNAGSILNIEITCPGYLVVNGVVTNVNDPPSGSLTNLAFYAGRLWGTDGNILYYSTGPDVTSGNGNTAWNVENFFETPGIIYRLWPTTSGLFILTNAGLWVQPGLGTSTDPFTQLQLVDQNISILSYDAFAIQGTNGLVYTADNLYLMIAPGTGVTWLGQPVANDLVNSFLPANVYLTYHSHGLDQEGFITDGSTHWLSWGVVPSPETGYYWNPPATINNGAAGVGAVASVMVSIGNYLLLLGPSGTGPILARASNYNYYEDNVTAYPAYAAFGNIVFAHHGQMAGLAFVGADFIDIGSVPQVSVMFDEVLNQPGTPPFVSVPNPISDPPNLPPSASLLQLRYWLLETQEPVFCRSGLFKFDFGSDNVQNEMLTFTVFGESITEELTL